MKVNLFITLVNSHDEIKIKLKDFQNLKIPQNLNNNILNEEILKNEMEEKNYNMKESN